MSYKAPVRDLSFVLHDVLKVESYGNQLPDADLSRDLIDQIVEEGGKFAEEVIAPINRTGDQEGCHPQLPVVMQEMGQDHAFVANDRDDSHRRAARACQLLGRADQDQGAIVIAGVGETVGGPDPGR